MYAHDNLKIPDCKADDKIVQQLINWLNYLGARVTQIKNAGGNNLPYARADSYNIEWMHNTLRIQLYLLPQQSSIACKRAERVVLCGSYLMDHDIESSYYQDKYYPKLKVVYENI